MTMRHRMTSLLTLGPVYGVESQWNDVGHTKHDMVDWTSKLKVPVLSLLRSKKVLDNDLLLTCTIFCANGTCKNKQATTEGETILLNI